MKLIKLKETLWAKGNRDKAILLFVLMLLIILIFPAFVFERSLRGSLDLHKQKYNELIMLSKEYEGLKGKIETAESKQSPTSKVGIANAVNDIFSSLGIKGKVKNITGISNRQLAGNISEESAEIYIEKVTMNELVNVFYKIETTPIVLSVKKAAIKKSFDKPELLNVTITLALFNLPPSVQP